MHMSFAANTVVIVIVFTNTDTWTFDLP